MYRDRLCINKVFSKSIMAAVIMFFAVVIISGCGANQEDRIMLDRNEDFTMDAFGANTYFFSPNDDPETVNAVLNDIWSRQEINQFGDERYSVYFLPGEYDERIGFKIGFYTQAAGLGKLPTDTRLSKVDVDARWLSDDSNHNATCNFWRGVENLSVSGSMMWAVSQATFMRRLDIDGALYLHDNYGWASGGFTADTHISMMMDSGSQQQWLSRNNDFKVWMGENWNLVFLGDAEGCNPVATWPGKPYTAVSETPIIREKPFLIYDETEGFGVFVPDVRYASKGVSWSEDNPGGSVRPISDFYIARSDVDDAVSINAALAEGKSIFFTPGIYDIEKPIIISNNGAILLGSGLATLRNVGGCECIRTKNVSDAIIAGLLIDAGEGYTETLMSVGEYAAEKHNDGHEIIAGAAAESPEGDSRSSGDLSHGVFLSDLFFRVGGASMNAAPKVGTCLVINSDNVTGDNFWIWRADHGDNVGWDVNSAKTGLAVNGRNVNIYALMVEHFEEYQTIWNGENGLVVMYQSELPYDVPSQSEWKSHDGEMDGYASIFIKPDIRSFSSYGVGIYSFNRDAAVVEHCVIEAPEGDGINIHNTCAVMITGHPGISHVINDVGKSCINPGDRAVVIDY